MDRYTIMGLINIQKQAIENVSDILICYPSEGVTLSHPLTTKTLCKICIFCVHNQTTLKYNS